MCCTCSLCTGILCTPLSLHWRMTRHPSCALWVVPSSAPPGAHGSSKSPPCTPAAPRHPSYTLLPSQLLTTLVIATAAIAPTATTTVAATAAVAAATIAAAAIPTAATTAVAAAAAAAAETATAALALGLRLVHTNGAALR